jgi:hypothetical protein
MWDAQKRARFQELRQRELAGALSEQEQGELSLLVQELECEEATHLNPATEQLRQERATIEAQNRALQALVARKETLVTKLRAVLEEAETERQAIDEEVARILGKHTGAGAGGRG